MVSSSKHSEFWIIPGGGVEGNEKPEDTALREVREEAGVHGHLGRLLGVFEVRRDLYWVVERFFAKANTVWLP